MTGALHHTMITVPIEKEKFRNQAAKDWETILLARAKELAPGKFSFFLVSLRHICCRSGNGFLNSCFF